VEYLPRRHGFLTETLRNYLEKERAKEDSKTRATTDYHMRELLKASVNDLIFVLQNLDDTQFDKVSSKVRESLDVLLALFCKRFVDRAGTLYPMSRYKAHNIRVGFQRWLSGNESMFLIGSMFQNAVDNAFGDDQFKVLILSKDACEDYKTWLAERHRDKGS
jgi:hypothetical protein